MTAGPKTAILKAEGKEFIGDVRVPTRQTFERYGLSREEWEALLAAQNGACGVCGSVPDGGTLHIDHEHVRGWKKFTPENKKRYVRGLVCWWDNTNLLRIGSTPARLRAAAQYLESYAVRRRSDV